MRIWRKRRSRGLGRPDALGRNERMHGGIGNNTSNDRKSALSSRFLDILVSEARKHSQSGVRAMPHCLICGVQVSSRPLSVKSNSCEVPRCPNRFARGYYAWVFLLEPSVTLPVGPCHTLADTVPAPHLRAFENGSNVPSFRC